MFKFPGNSTEQRVELISDKLGNSMDVNVRKFKTHAGQAGALLSLGGLSDQDKADKWILPWILQEGEKQRITEDSLSKSIPIQQMKLELDLEKVIDSLLSGEAALVLDGVSAYCLLGIQKWEHRSLSEPMVESTIKGPQEGFSETLSVNISLIRRILKNPRLHVKECTIGELSNTRVAVLYLDGLVKQEVLAEVESRLQEIKTDVLLAASQLEQWIEDSSWTPFSLIRSTDRPDVTSISLAEGKVAILVDHSPFALLVPFTFSDSVQNMDDYYEKWFIATAVRMIRLIAFVIGLTLPSLYIALVHYNPGLIPMELLMSMIGARTHVPFPAFWELILMEITIEIFREAGIRLPKALGPTIGIVGGIVIGDAAVRANLVSPITLIVVGLTTMASFSIPVYSMAFTFRFLRFLLTLAAGLLGIYGLMLGIMMLLVHLCSLQSFGISYLSPVAPSRWSDWKDQIILGPVRWRNKRPSYLTEAKEKSRWRPLRKD